MPGGPGRYNPGTHPEVPPLRGTDELIPVKTGLIVTAPRCRYYRHEVCYLPTVYTTDSGRKQMTSAWRYVDVGVALATIHIPH